MRVERLGSLVPGYRVPFHINGTLKYYTCQHDKDHGTDYVKIEGKRLTNENCPFGEEIDI